MMLTLMLTSKGVAGVPRAALVILTGDAEHLRPAARGRRHPAGHRSAARHGPDGGERDGQLHRHRGRRAVGGRAGRRADAPIAGPGGVSGSRFRGAHGAKTRIWGEDDENCGHWRRRPARARDGAAPVRASRGDGADARRPRRVPTAAMCSRVMAAIRPDAIVNCAAYNAVDRAEDDVLAALEGNAFGGAGARAGGGARGRGARALQHRFRVRRERRLAVRARTPPSRR